MSSLRRRFIRNAGAAFARSADRYEAEKVRRRGFSMIELAVVLVVVGVIAAISMPTFQSTIQRASEKAELIEVTSAMRNAVTLAAINEPGPERGRSRSRSADDPGAVVLAASGRTPA
ncbi:MAG: prepilin-type N-terminal cleavage/methylation domain-containing protein [Microthrixaceae bacterium]